MTAFGKVPMLTPLGNYGFDRYTPSAYSPAMNVYEELVMIREYLNQVIISQNNVNNNFNLLLEWVNEQLKKYAKEEIEKIFTTDEIKQIVNEMLGNKFGFNVKDYGAKGDGIVDDTEAIQNCINDAYAHRVINTQTRGVTVNIPQGIYMVDTIYIPQNVNIVGEGSWAVTLRKLPDKCGPIMSWRTEAPSWYFKPRYQGFYLEGQKGKDGCANVTGMQIHPYWGLDCPIFEDIQIRYCSAWGIHVSPEFNPETAKQTMQQGSFRNVIVEYCGAGAMYQEGFIGNMIYDTCRFEPVWKSADTANGTGISFQTESSGGHMMQDATFINCAFQFAKLGFVSDTGYQNATFVGCHFEDNLESSVRTKHDNRNTTLFSGCSFSTTKIDLDIQQKDGYMTFEEIKYNPLVSAGAENIWLQLAERFEGMVYVGFGRAMSYNFDWMTIVDPKKRVRGWVDQRATKYVVDQLQVRGLQSSQSTVPANNLSGRATFAQGIKERTLNFFLQERDANYSVFITVDNSHIPFGVSVKDKTQDGFTVCLEPIGGQMPQNSVGVNWFISR